MALDIKGKTFGRLTAIECVGSDIHKNKLWRFKCECGNETIAAGKTVAKGAIRSCGCLRAERLSETAKEWAAEKLKRRETWAAGMADEHHAKFYADGYVYIISDSGEVFGPSGKLAQMTDSNGYLRFKRKSVHRLVAKAFVPGYFDGAEVDHINAVRYDNRKDNLRWVTPEQNKEYAKGAIIEANKRRAKYYSAG